jgi:hypothetical protein
VEPVDLAPEGGVESAVCRVVRHERLTKLALEGAPVRHGQPRHFGIDLTSDLVLPALVCAVTLEVAKSGHGSSVMQARCREAVT